MGRQTLAKQEKFAQAEACYAECFRQHNIKAKAHTDDKTAVDFNVQIEPFKDKIYRDPLLYKSKLKSSNQSKQFLEFARYVFGKYSVNSILSRVWSVERVVNLNLNMFRQWYICVATGGSFYKEHAKEFFTKKECHIFLNCNYDLSIEQARVYAVAKALNVNDGQALRLARSKLATRPFSDFWRGVIRYFSTNEPSSISVMNDLVDYIADRKNANPNFTLFGAGYTIQSLLVKMEEWHRALQRSKVLGDVKWEGAPIDNFSVERKDTYGNDVVWNLTQILDTKTLAAEGSRMRHCVLSYKSQCILGHCSIWQLTMTDYLGVLHHKATIEVSNHGEIVQARGLANRQLRSEELHILHMWTIKSGLGISRLI